MSEPYVANTLTSVFKANGILFPLYVDPLKLIIFVCNRSAFLTALQKNVVISVQRSSACRPQVALFCRLVRALVNMTWFLSVLSALIHSSSCMHSCDVSLCVGSRGAWSEVHVGQYGSSVVMTIILLKCAVQKIKNKKKGKLVYVRLQFCSSSSKSRLFRFAWQSSCYSRAELLWSPKRCCNQQSLLSPIRSQS